MSRSAYRKDIRREISHTFGRFICIFLISALGVAFFTGIRICEPVMNKSADRLFDESSLMDLEVISTGGLTDADVEAISSVEGVENVMPAYSADMLDYIGTEQNVIKVISLPDRLNNVRLISGRMPVAPDECVIDSQLTSFHAEYNIGDTITVLDADSEESALSINSFRVVGTVTSPLYLDFSRGSSKLGSGSVLGFIMISPEVFTQDYYSVIYVTGTGLKELISYSDKYNDKVDLLKERIEAIAGTRTLARKEELIDLVGDKIQNARNELETKKQDALNDLKDARAELDDGYAKLEDARAEIAAGEEELKSNRLELENAAHELADRELEYADGLRKYNEGIKLLQEKEQELKDTRDSLNEGWDDYDKAKAQTDAAGAQLEIFRSEVANAAAQFEAGKEFMDEAAAAAAEQEVLAAQAQLAAAEEQYAEGLRQVNALFLMLDGYEDAYRDEALPALEKGRRDLEANRIQLEEGRIQLDNAQSELTEGFSKLAEAENKLVNAGRDIERSARELEEGEAEYSRGLADFDKEIADAEAEINDSEADAYSSVKLPEWYVLDRSYITSVGEFGLNAEKIGAIGKVFPAIFFIVAILVCLTTMTRMVEENRTEIGTLKALGYSNFAVARKFILYGFSASILGSIFGVLLGENILPYCIVNAYYILYTNIPYIELGIDLKLSILAGIIACACTLFATLMACQRATREKAAELMRPVAPLPGKRVFLENIGFIWKHLSFTMKASVRNLLRYTKRFLMTVVGIGGCMALMLVGFGLHDSIFTIIDNQFFKIMVYDAIVTLNTDDEEAVEELVKFVESSPVAASDMLMHQSATNSGANDVEKEAYVVVPSVPDEMSDFIYLGDRKSGTSFLLTDYSDGVIINEKLASLLKVDVGDEIYVTDEDNLRLPARISAITENYVYNYIYMTPEMYQNIFGTMPEYNVLYFNEAENADSKAASEFGRLVLKQEAASGISYASTSADTIYDMMSSLNFVVYVLVTAAALLAFVVLYNLSNINVNERRRELATLKVLGFYDHEVSAYVYRENIMLTVIGVAIGIVFGIFLHRYVILTAEVDMTLFGRNIKPLSYLYSMLLTFLFAALVNLVMHYKLKKIDMVESLKSVE